MKLQLLYHEYLNLKFNRGLPSVPFDGFEYGLLEEDGAELFFVERKDEAFVEWTYELQPRDPHYVVSPDWKPVLSAFLTIWTSTMNSCSITCYLRSTRRRPS